MGNLPSPKSVGVAMAMMATALLLTVVVALSDAPDFIKATGLFTALRICVAVLSGVLAWFWWIVLVAKDT